MSGVVQREVLQLALKCKCSECQNCIADANRPEERGYEGGGRGREPTARVRCAGKRTRGAATARSGLRRRRNDIAQNASGFIVCVCLGIHTVMPTSCARSTAARSAWHAMRRSTQTAPAESSSPSRPRIPPQQRSTPLQPVMPMRRAFAWTWDDVIRCALLPNGQGESAATSPDMAPLHRSRLCMAASIAWAFSRLPAEEQHNVVQVKRGGQSGRLLIWIVGAREPLRASCS